jgi:hypothetical protein
MPDYNRNILQKNGVPVSAGTPKQQEGHGVRAVKSYCLHQQLL